MASQTFNSMSSRVCTRNQQTAEMGSNSSYLFPELDRREQNGDINMHMSAIHTIKTLCLILFAVRGNNKNRNKDINCHCHTGEQLHRLSAVQTLVPGKAFQVLPGPFLLPWLPSHWLPCYALAPSQHRASPCGSSTSVKPSLQATQVEKSKLQPCSTKPSLISTLFKLLEYSRQPVTSLTDQFSPLLHGGGIHCCGFTENITQHPGGAQKPSARGIY